MVDLCIAFIIGMFVGAFLGILTMAVLTMAGRMNEMDEYPIDMVNKAEEENAE